MATETYNVIGYKAAIVDMLALVNCTMTDKFPPTKEGDMDINVSVESSADADALNEFCEDHYLSCELV